MRTSGGDLKLMNYLNADCAMGSMMKANKSKRSSLTGGKKRVARKYGSGTHFFGHKADDFMGSDTEKQGVAILGCRFSENVECVPVESVPLKKRRSHVLSLQPQFGVADLNLNGRQQRRTVDTFSTTMLNIEVLKENGENDESLEGENILGIDILADVACNDGLIKNGGGSDHNEEIPLMQESTPEDVDSSASAARPEAMLTCHLMSEDKLEASCRPNSTATASQKSEALTDSNIVVEESEALSVDKSEVSAAPREEVTALPGHLVSEDKLETLSRPNSTDTASQKSEALTVSNKVVDESLSLRSQRLHWDLNVTMDAWEQPYGTIDADQEENLAPCISTVSKNRLPEESKALTDNSAGVAQSISTVGIGNTQILVSPESQENHEDVRENIVRVYSHDRHNSNGEETDYEVLRGINGNHNDSVPSTSNTVQEPFNQVVQTFEDPSTSSQGNVVSEIPLKVEACNVSLTPKEKDKDLSAMCEIDPAIALKDVQTATDVHKDVESIKLKANPDKHGVDCDCSNNLCVSGVDVKCKSNEEKLAVVSRSPADFGFDKLMWKSCVGGTDRVNLTTEDYNSNESYASDVYQADKVDMVGTDEVHTGYSSQIEDGEFRESDTRYWDESGEDGEVQHFHCGCDCEEGKDILDKNNEKKLFVESGLRENMMRKTKYETGVGLIRSYKDYHPSYVSRLRESSRELPSQIEVADGLCGKDAVMRSRDNIYCNFYSRDGRESSSRRYISRNLAPSYRTSGRSPRERDHHRFSNSSSSYWDSECNYSSTSHSSYGHKTGVGVLETRGTNVPGNHSVESGLESSYHRRIMRRRSPSNRDEAYRWRNNGPLPIRDNTSPTRNRFRRFPLQRNHGDIREKHRRPALSNDSGYSNRASHRERTISPIRGRQHYVSTYRKCRSRSRSPSPIGYVPTKERSRGSRFCSRSPDFRPDDRIIDRARLRFQKRFVPDREDGMVSSPRADWFSPKCNNGLRWLNDKNNSSDDFRARKQQQMGVFRQSQRFDLGYSIRRFHLDEKFQSQSTKFRPEDE